MNGARISAFASGLLFAVGLGISGMTEPGKVFAFLDVTGSWDPSLAFVMVGAIGAHLLLYRLILRRQSPLYAGEFHLPTRRDLDRRLLTGAVLFGLGWGLAGFCPGPALVSAAGGMKAAWIFVPAMIGGMALFQMWDQRRSLVAAPAARRPQSSAG